jgi:hypothetical protein
MRGTRIEKVVEIYATDLANKTKCMSTNAKKWIYFCEDIVSTSSAICGVNPEHSTPLPRNRVAQLYPQALDSLFVSCDS